MELEFELEFELELLLEFELELELEFELELLLWLELEFELWFELELLLWLELELELWFELALLLWFEFWFELAFGRWARMRLIVRRLLTARARHHSIGMPSIFRSMVTTRGFGAGREAAGAFAAACTDLRAIGASVARSPCDRFVRESKEDPAARPRAPSAPA